MSLSKFIDFLEEMNTPAVQYAMEMEKIIFHDPSSAIVKARKFAEVIVNEVFIKENLEVPYTSFYEKTSYLTREDYINRRDIQKSFDTIRLIGNKAAHPGEYNDLADAYKLHRELYNITVWFYEVYIVEQIKVPPYETPQPPKQNNVEEIIQKKLAELLGKDGFEAYTKQSEVEEDDNEDPQEEDSETQPILQKNLDDGESYLSREVQRLKDSSQEAIENANQFSRFKNYLHVDRKVQKDLEEVLAKNNQKEQGSLILLCGNVGDGKSHLLAYLKENKPELIENYTIFNDATESFSPNKDAMETLSEILNGFSDQNFGFSNDNVILAINMGVLHNFITTEHEHYTYNLLKEFIDDSKLFTQDITAHFSSDNFDLISFGDYHSYELTSKGPISSFYSSLLERITMETNDNPFHLAYREDETSGIHTMVHENYKMLQNQRVQESIIQLVVQAIVKKKLVISARAFLNFIADILIPDEISKFKMLSEFEVLEQSLPNLLFNRKERSEILNAISDLDPLHCRSVHIDQLVIDLNTLSNWDSIISENIKDDTPIKWLNSFVTKEALMGYTFNLFFESFIRNTYLTNEKFADNIADTSYTEYLKNLFAFNKGEMQEVKRFYEEFKSAIFKWKGSPKKDYVYLNKPSEKYRLAQRINLRPTIDHLEPRRDEVLESFKSTILIGYRDADNQKKIYLDIDYPLYSLLTKVREGYRPNKKDEEDAIKFVEFIDKLMAFGEKKEEMQVFFKADQRFYSISKDDFGSFVFERE
nr:DNA phosphorothioation-dependent restriction protein DptF [Sediminibacillus massiliensis]